MLLQTVSITHKLIKDTLLFCLGLLLIGLLIEVICVIVNETFIFPHITTTLKEFFKLFAKKTTYVYSGKTVLHLIESLAFAGFFGVTLGILSGVYKNLYVVLKPIMSMLRSLPIIVIIVALMLILIDNTTPVWATSLVLVPLIYEGVYQGVAHLDKDLTSVYKLDSKLTPYVVFKVYLPLIASYSKTVFISAIGMGIKVLITTEYMAGVANTLGFAVQVSYSSLSFDMLYPYSMLMVVLTLILEGIPYLGIYAYSSIKTHMSEKRNRKFLESAN